MNKQLQSGGLLAVGMAGIAGGFSVGGLFKRLRRPTPNQILSQVKRAFLKEAPIEGSWIEMKKSPLQKFALRTDVYYGGITRYEDGQLVQYEFLADANTGSILDIYRL